MYDNDLQKVSKKVHSKTGWRPFVAPGAPLAPQPSSMESASKVLRKWPQGAKVDTQSGAKGIKATPKSCSKPQFHDWPYQCSRPGGLREALTINPVNPHTARHYGAWKTLKQTVLRMGPPATKTLPRCVAGTFLMYWRHCYTWMQKTWDWLGFTTIYVSTNNSYAIYMTMI